MYSQQAVGLVLRPSNEGMIQTFCFLTGRCNPNRQLVGQRRRWESNPLRAALQAAAGPSGSSVRKCPGQESNLIYKLRGLVCESSTLPGPYVFNRAELALKGDRRELNPYLLLHRQMCLPRTPRTPF